jgi:hypothetical protein
VFWKEKKTQGEEEGGRESYNNINCSNRYWVKNIKGKGKKN